MGGYTEDLLDKPIEYIAWGAVYWSAARRRTSRSPNRESGDPR